MFGRCSWRSDRRRRQSQRSPVGELTQEASKLLSSRGERVRGTGDRPCKHIPSHRLVALELSQPLGEGLLADAAHACEQFSMAQRTVLKVVDDERGPLAADEMSGSLGGMVLGSHAGKRSQAPFGAFLVGWTGQTYVGDHARKSTR